MHSTTSIVECGTIPWSLSTATSGLRFCHSIILNSPASRAALPAVAPAPCVWDFFPHSALARFRSVQFQAPEFHFSRSGPLSFISVKFCSTCIQCPLPGLIPLSVGAVANHCNLFATICNVQPSVRTFMHPLTSEIGSHCLCPPTCCLLVENTVRGDVHHLCWS